MFGTRGDEVRAGILLLLVGSGTACGSGEAAETKRGAADTTATEVVRTSQANPEKAAATMMEAMGEAVELPSHRRLAAFLPANLPGFASSVLESEHEVAPGRAIARGRYQPSAFDFMNGVEVEISYYGKQVFNVPQQLFETGLGKRVQIAGFDAMTDEDESLGKKRFELYVRVSSELWVQVSGPEPYEQVREAAEAVDLKALAAALADEKLFEEAPEDVLERTLLSGDALAELMPASIGPVGRQGKNGFEMFDADPLHSRATAQYGSGTLTLYDYGDAEVAQAIELSARSLQGFTMFTGSSDSAARDEVLEVSDGHGSCALLREEPPRSSVVAVHLARGRFVAEYVGRFVAAPELSDSLPAEVKKEIERANEQMGAGAFESIEAQRDAILVALEALDINASNN